MHIEFKRIILHNFMSFGTADLRFIDDGFIRVSGVNENPQDNAGSNGSGKSSLWEAIVWVITGETIRGTKQVVNLHGEDGCYVDIEFYIDKTRYQLIRSKDHKIRKTNLQILINGEDCSGKGIRDSEKLLQQYLPDLTASLLGSVIILGQGLPQKFTNNTPSGRKEVLEKLSKSDFMIEDLKQRVADRKATLMKDQRQVEDTLLQLTTQKTVLESQIKQSQEVLDTLDGAKLTEEYHTCVVRKDTLTEELTNLRLQCDELTEQQSAIKQEETTIVADQLNESNIVKLNYDKQVNPHISRLNELRAQLTVNTNELNRIQNIKDICPTCGQKISNVHKPDTSAIEITIDTLNEQLSDVNSLVSDCKNEYESELKNIQDKYRDIKLLCAQRMNNVSQQLSTVRISIRNCEEKLLATTQELSELTKKLSEVDTTRAFNNKIVIENNEKLLVIDSDIMYNNMQKDLARVHLDIVSKFDTALKRDFRGYLLSTVISYIEARAKQYCKVIFDTTDIGFCLDGNNIDITYMNKAYENLSGGEKQKIDLIIQFSIRDMLSTQLNFTSNILVLDEVFDGLDMIGCNRVIDMISNLSDIKNVFIVTHRRDLSIPNDRELIVAKSSAGISEIRQ